MTSPLHGENPGFKSPWAHFLISILDPNTTRKYMIELGAQQKIMPIRILQSQSGVQRPDVDTPGTLL